VAQGAAVRWVDAFFRVLNADWSPSVTWVLRGFTLYFVVHMLWTGRWINLLVISAIGVSLGVALGVAGAIRKDRLERAEVERFWREVDGNGNLES
jgi:hypothetical protein